MKLNVLDIIKGTTVDGSGFRTAIYLSGCSHNCPGCHNPQSHNADAGSAMSLDDILAVVKQEDFDVTLTGGDPLYNVEASRILAKTIKDCGYNIWLYTGYTWEQVTASPTLSRILDVVDVLVDGPFIDTLKDPDLQFRGSSNQRLIDVKASLQCGNITLWSY